MLVALALGMVAANSPLADTYALLHHLPLHVGVGPFTIEAPLIDWINQGLLTVFFFLIGLHTKHEITSGALSEPGAVAVPAIASMGGMILPSALYLAFNYANPVALRGWAIPIATDIVLVLGFLSLLSGRVAPAVIAFATAVAIFDDLGSVAIIALFYGEIEVLWPLWMVAVGLSALLLLNRRRKVSLTPYLAAGSLLWFGLVLGGLEGALAGAIVGLSLPLSSFPPKVASRTERRISPVALFFVVPVFAFFNGGVALDFAPADPQAGSVALGIAAAMVIGKPAGILVGTFVVLRLGIGSLPRGTTRRDLLTVALLSGIGFTMSLFIVGAAFNASPLADTAKLTVIAASTIAAVLAFVLVSIRVKAPRGKQ